MPVALVTGASRGIGAAIATALARDGFDVAVGFGSDAEGAARTVAAVTALGRAAVALQADVADEQQAGGLVDAAEEQLGPLDAVVLNAGITRDGLFLRMSAEDWCAVIDTNLSGAFFVSRAAVRGMMRRRSGSIVAVSSVVGLIGNPGQANYAAAKAGMIGMAKSMAHEVASRGITVNCIAPGFVTSAMTEPLQGDHKAKLLAGIPIGRMGEPAEIAAAAVYLASNEAAYVTGQTMHVNGGMAMI